MDPPTSIRPPAYLHPLSSPLPPIPRTPSNKSLIPQPLFTKKRRRTILPPETIHVAVLEFPSSPTSSPPSSPTSRPRSQSNLSQTSSSSSSSEWGPSPLPALRRKPSPKRDTLRALRAKDSDASLQRIYESQTLAYLNGKLFGRSKLGVEIGD